jgi:O-antigen/teichoic acid export membrane protein
MTSSRLLARNSALNVVGQASPLVLAIVAIPLLIRGFGAERFGVLTLVWAAIGYFGLFEFGLGRALTQAIAQRLGTEAERELPAIARTGLLLLVGLSLVGAVLLALLTPALVTLLHLPEALQSETIVSFWILAGALPFVLASVGMRGLMEAHQHFGIVTLLRLPLIAFTIVGPLLVLPYSNGLVPAVSVIAAGRILAFVAHVVVCLRLYPYVKAPATIRRDAARALIRFGGWMTISNIVSPLMVYLDRFVLGALLGMAAVTAYVTPFELVVRLLIIPAALTGAILPALASVAGDSQRMGEIYEKSFRAVMIVMFPMMLVAVVLAHEGLQWWIGPVLPAESVRVLQWLAVGVFVTAIAQAPFTALQSAGRPDLIAKLHLVELPLYAVAIVVFVRSFGVQGIAIAWTLRATVDALALLWLAHRRLGLRAVPRVGGAWPILLMLAAMGAGTLIATTGARLLFVISVCATFIPVAWLALLTPSERTGLRASLRARAPAAALEEARTP